MRLWLSLILVALSFGVVSLKLGLTGYAVIFIYMLSVIWGARIFSGLNPGRELWWLLLAPPALFMVFLFTEDAMPRASGFLVNIFDDYFSGVFFGIRQTSEELFSDGYIARARSIKAEMIVAFALVLLFSWRFIVSCLAISTLRQGYTEPAKAGVHAAYVILILACTFIATSLDLYSPSCTVRCSGIQRSSLSLAWILVALMLISALSGLWLSVFRSNYLLKLRQKGSSKE